jgi:hypothetical protein
LNKIKQAEVFCLLLQLRMAVVLPAGRHTGGRVIRFLFTWLVLPPGVTLCFYGIKNAPDVYVPQKRYRK